jgi:hypothetical protein
LARYAADDTLEWARIVDLRDGAVSVDETGRLSVIGTTLWAPTILGGGSVTPVVLEYEPGDSTDDDEILLTWWTGDGVPDRSAWVAACTNRYASKLPRVFPQPDGTELVTVHVDDRCELLLPSGSVEVGAFGDLQTVVTRAAW